MELGKKRKNAATLPYQAPAASSASATVSYANRKKSGVKRRQEAQDLFELSIRDRIEESDMYTQLLEFERKLDRNLTRRRADLEDAFNTSTRQSRRLRIATFHTPQQHEGAWTLRIQLQPDEPNAEGKPPPMRGDPKFCSLFRRITVEFDRTKYVDDWLVHWERKGDEQTKLAEGFEVHKFGNFACDVRILLEVEHTPPRFKLSAALAKVLGVKTESRAGLIRRLWAYIKQHHLQLAHDYALIRNNAPLRTALGVDQMQVSNIATILAGHMFPVDPTEIRYTVDPSVAQPEPQITYVDIDMETQPEFVSNWHLSGARDVQTIDEDIHKMIEEVNARKYKRDFMRGFAQSPVSFANRLVASQARDFRASLIEGRPNLQQKEEERRAYFYRQSWLDDAVKQYLKSAHAEHSLPM